MLIVGLMSPSSSLLHVRLVLNKVGHLFNRMTYDAYRVGFRTRSVLPPSDTVGAYTIPVMHSCQIYARFRAVAICRLLRNTLGMDQMSPGPTGSRGTPIAGVFLLPFFVTPCLPRVSDWMEDWMEGCGGKCHDTACFA